jgi:hypothetical protein
LFDLNDQMENVPNEIKDVEIHLLQQYCSYQEPINYTDLLINIIKSIRNKWHLNDQFNCFNDSNSNTSCDGNNRQQSINIQFKR